MGTPDTPVMRLVGKGTLPGMPTGGSTLTANVLTASSGFAPRLVGVLAVKVMGADAGPTPGAILISSLGTLFDTLPNFLIYETTTAGTLVAGGPPNGCEKLGLTLASTSPGAIMGSGITLIGGSSGPTGALRRADGATADGWKGRTVATSVFLLIGSDIASSLLAADLPVRSLNRFF